MVWRAVEDTTSTDIAGPGVCTGTTVTLAADGRFNVDCRTYGAGQVRYQASGKLAAPELAAIDAQVRAIAQAPGAWACEPRGGMSPFGTALTRATGERVELYRSSVSERCVAGDPGRVEALQAALRSAVTTYLQWPRTPPGE